MSGGKTGDWGLGTGDWGGWRRSSADFRWRAPRLTRADMKRAADADVGRKKKNERLLTIFFENLHNITSSSVLNVLAQAL